MTTLSTSVLPQEVVISYYKLLVLLLVLSYYYFSTWLCWMTSPLFFCCLGQKQHRPHHYFVLQFPWWSAQRLWKFTLIQFLVYGIGHWLPHCTLIRKNKTNSQIISLGGKRPNCHRLSIRTTIQSKMHLLNIVIDWKHALAWLNLPRPRGRVRGSDWPKLVNFESW